MKLNEHNSKVLLSRSGIPAPQGDLLDLSQVENYSPAFPFPVVVKAQVLSGGRGKAGGVKLAANPEELKTTAQQILGLTIKEERVPFVRVEPAADIQREIYLSISLVRATGRFALTIGREGGVDIESSGPDNLLIMDVDPLIGLCQHQVRQGFFHLGLEKSLLKPWAELVNNLFQAVCKHRLLLAEINPLILTSKGDLEALDGKVEIDDNFADLHPDLNEFFEPRHFGPEENAARKAGLSYHKLHGSVGLMVNGAGLAMATMDLLNFSGLPVANFLDLGGGADQERMGKALEILFLDDSARTIFINIFGGILSCEKVALALSGALKGQDPPKPMVVRFSGFKSKEAGEIIRSLNSRDIHAVDDLTSAVDALKKISPDQADLPEFKRIELSGESSPVLTRTLGQDLPFPINRETRVLVQGITGREGSLHTREMLSYGTRIVAGVTPFKGGTEVQGVPVYNTVSAACAQHRIEASIIFVPAAFAADAILEAVSCSIPWIVCITEGIPQQDMARILPAVRCSNSRLIGPNTPGIIVPGQTKIGIMPGSVFTPGPVAVLSRSGTLTYECVHRLSRAGIGQSLCAGIGGDPFIGQDFIDICRLLHDDPACKALLILGEIGGTAEEDLGRELKKSRFNRPVLGFIAGQTAPPGKRLGHAGAILDPSGGGIRTKLEAMHRSGMIICPDLASIPELVSRALADRQTF
ncbi:succinate--CoA ligase subunit alpha [Desulfonatronovibrio hydrogenovorans]|uniref:succinate--CoA ligase subunit alpha n=1 Tax=Desulfonatronovibrio hydrogenovorans TaxID=53245 RepID=UPI00048A7412|nr:succinate--CoA ligase subunit alpha [Desulfonatronovibrio hydrogenovorans]